MIDKDDSEMINHLILEGALEVAAVDGDTGEFLYTFTPKLKDVMPELYEEHISHVQSEIMGLWEKGFVNVDLLSSDPRVTLTPKALDAEAIRTLSKEEQWSLNEVKRLLH